MWVTTGWIRLSLAAALAASAPPACGERAVGESAGGDRSAGVSVAAKGSPCPSAEHISTAVGSPVTFTTSFGARWMTCMYELTDPYRGVFVELTTQPATRADEAYAELRRVTKGMNGQDATPDPVELGEGGLAFGSGSMSRAAVVAKGVLYQASMDYMAVEGIGDRKDAMVRVLQLAIR
jgi:hypothetical protein